MNYYFLILPFVVVIAIAYKAVLGRRKARVQRLNAKYVNMAHDDYTRLLLVIKRSKTKHDLDDMEYEVDQFYANYADFIELKTLDGLSLMLNDHIRIRRAFIRN